MFDPLVLGTLTAKNSIIRAATAESLATSAGKPTQELVGKLEELAAGGVGTIITGYAYVTQDGKPSAQWEVEVLVTETGCEVLCW